MSDLCKNCDHAGGYHWYGSCELCRCYLYDPIGDFPIEVQPGEPLSGPREVDESDPAFD